MEIKTRTSSLTLLVCVMLISKMGMMLHELEHDLFSEEKHYCAICLSSTPLDTGPSDSYYLLFNIDLGHVSEIRNFSSIYHRPIYRFLSRAPPANFFV